MLFLNNGDNCCLTTDFNIHKIWIAVYFNIEEHYLLRYNVVWTFESQPTFRRNLCLHIQGRISWATYQIEFGLQQALMLVSRPASSTLKMEAITSSQKIVLFMTTAARTPNLLSNLGWHNVLSRIRFVHLTVILIFGSKTWNWLAAFKLLLEH
jgi:hypothetical protein